MVETVTRAADAAPELNPALDAAALHQAFRQKGRVHIPGILTETSAARLLQCLQKDIQWTVTLNKGADFLDFENVPQAERTRFAFGAWERARNGAFQYLFDNHRLSRNGEPYRDPKHHLAKLVAFLNGPPFLDLMRRVTGLDAIAWTDAQATLYRPGDFLTVHDDQTGGHKRLAAYVLNLTPAWRPEWGGVLEFVDDTSSTVEGYVPTFNALNVFRVPQHHFVSQVALYGGLRYSVTGWLHAR